jgi:hypothetical protein
VRPVLFSPNKTVYLFIFFHVKENEPKENTVPRFILRVVDSAGSRGNSPRLRQGFGGTQTGPRAFIRPYRRCSARDKGKFKTKTSKAVFKPTSRGFF